MTDRRSFLKTCCLNPVAAMLGTWSVQAWGRTDQPRDDLRGRCIGSLRKIYAGDPQRYWKGDLAKPVLGRLDEELEIIAQLGLVDDFRGLWDLSAHLQNKDVPVFVHGLANGSLVIFASGLSSVCPLEHDLLFDLFLTGEEIGPVDLNLCVPRGQERLLAGLVPRPLSQSGRVCSLSIRVDQYPLLNDLDDMVQRVKENHQLPPSWPRLPLDDAATFGYLQATDVEELQPEGMHDFQRRVEMPSFNDLMASLVLFRPRPLADHLGEEYVRRKKGGQPIRYVHRVQEQILAETYGLCLYQEQVVRLFHRLGGIPLPEGRKLSRSMWQDGVQVESIRETFIRGSVSQTLSKRTAEAIFDELAGPARYSFPKAHAAALMHWHYQMAFLKAHFPEELLQ